MADILGIEQVADMRDFEKMKNEMYTYYGINRILGAKLKEYNFPEPLIFAQTKTPKPEKIQNHQEMFLKHLLLDGAKTLLPVIELVLAKEHKKNPIFSGEIDRESLAQIVDRAFLAAKQNKTTIGGFTIEHYENNGFSQTVKALINALILMDLLVWKNKTKGVH